MFTKNSWLYFLRFACLVTIFTGLIASVASHPNGDFLWKYLFDVLKNFDPMRPTLFSQDHYALNAVLGGVMIGWGVFMYYMSAPSLFSEPIRKGFIWSLVSWFICDSVGSLAAGLLGNILLNVIFFTIFILPLYMLRPAKP